MVPQRLLIDIVDVCNLNCTDCPRGQGAIKSTNKRMSIDDLSRILDKAEAECKLVNVSLYNWTEPFLHPKLAEMIRTVKSRDVSCSLSTNLALKKKPALEEVLIQRPDEIIVSVSGFSQEIYSRYHRGGDIEVVKSNLRTMAGVLKTHRISGVKIEVHYLQFVNNLHESPLMKDFCDELGMGFLEMPANSAEGATTEESSKYLLPRNQQNAFGVDIDEDLEIKKSWPCQLLDDIQVIDVNGDSYLCCGCGNFPHYFIGNFMTTSFRDLFRKRMTHELCEGCLNFRREPQTTDLLLRYADGMEKEASPVHRAAIAHVQSELRKQTGFSGFVR